MNLLAKLKPAETLIHLEGSKAELKQLMKLTFMDLVLKQVLVVKESVQTLKSGRKYKELVILYVIKGKNFDSYKPSKFEFIYLSPFHKSPEIKAIFTKLIKVAYEAIGTEKKYRKLIIETSPLKQVIKTTFLDGIFGTFSLSSEGQKTRASIQGRLDQIDAKIGDTLQTNPTEALEILIEIGGNVFLLKNLDFELLRKIDPSIMESIRSANNVESRENYSSNEYFWFYSDGLWSDSNYDSWDSSFSSFDSFDSGFDAAGCSSHDSVCSSCSGCGGCGGCGS